MQRHVHWSEGSFVYEGYQDTDTQQAKAVQAWKAAGPHAAQAMAQDNARAYGGSRIRQVPALAAGSVTTATDVARQVAVPIPGTTLGTRSRGRR